MQRFTLPSALVSILLTGGIFGFFYAWVCSTMWGLDATDPRTAIAAMQAMNASVRNAIFAPTFFGTAPALLLTAGLALASGRRLPATLFAVAALTYALGGFILTVSVNVPMNEALAAVAIPDDAEAARAIWADYSSRWQVFNQIRTIASGAALLLSALGLYALGQ